MVESIKPPLKAKDLSNSPLTDAIRFSVFTEGKYNLRASGETFLFRFCCPVNSALKFVHAKFEMFGPNSMLVCKRTILLNVQLCRRGLGAGDR